MGERGRDGAGVAERDVAKLDGARKTVCAQLSVGHGRDALEDLVHAPCACLGLREGVHEVCELEQLHEHLAHVVHERHEGSLREVTRLDADAADVEHNDEPQVHGGIREWVHEAGDVTHVDLTMPEAIEQVVEQAALLVLSTEGSQDAHALELLGRGEQDAIEAVLDLAVAPDGHAHDEPDEQKDDGGHDNEQRSLGAAHEVCGTYGAEDGDGAAKDEAKEEVHAVLDLARVVGEPRDERGGAELVDVGAGERHDMGEEIVSKCRAKPGAKLGREVLGRDCADPTHEAHGNEGGRARHDVVGVACCYALVDDACHDERHENLECGLKALEQRRQNAFLAIAPEVSDKLEHAGDLRLMVR